MRLRIFVLILFLFSAVSAFSFEEVKTLSLKADGIEKLVIECGSGFLEVRGNEALDTFKVKAEIIVKGKSEDKAKEFIKKYVELYLEKRGNRAVLVSKFKPYRSLFSFRKRVINLTVDVPQHISLNIDDGSGSMIVENIRGDMEIDDGSGSTSLKDIEGEIIIDDGSGEIDIEDVVGTVRIDDGSGDVEIIKVTGDVEIDDGSGDIEARDIDGNVEVDDSSGSMYLVNIQGDVVVSDSSGSINIDGVEKDVTIKRDSSGKVNIKNVRGKVIK